MERSDWTPPVSSALMWAVPTALIVICTGRAAEDECLTHLRK